MFRKLEAIKKYSTVDSVAGDFIVGDTPLHVVFPNAKVEIGARAALLVAPSHAS